MSRWLLVRTHVVEPWPPPHNHVWIADTMFCGERIDRYGVTREEALSRLREAVEELAGARDFHMLDHEDVLRDSKGNPPKHFESLPGHHEVQVLTDDELLEHWSLDAAEFWTTLWAEPKPAPDLTGADPGLAEAQEARPREEVDG